MATDHNQDLDANVVSDNTYAELGPTIARKVGEPVQHRRAAAAEVADEDLHIERKDLGDDSSTFIAKGAPIPPELAELPRRPARGSHVRSRP
jgi:hypothetical protein